MSDLPSPSDSASTVPAARALEHVRLFLKDGVAHVAPSDGTPAGTAPIPLPPIPMSLTEWLAFFGQKFLARHRRCAAALLLLDCSTGLWAMTLPAQRAGRDACCWEITGRHLPVVPPGMLVAGSFQTRVFSPGEAVADAVPPVDGVHLVHHQVGGQFRVDCFVCMQGAISPIPVEVLLVDDMEIALQSAMPRITLV
ncbi:MAG: hypothetical protein JWN24_4832 [Phycisphaerales bacterium]|nr:hypothetical protein [Phycisphaerales bacterium]